MTTPGTGTGPKRTELERKLDRPKIVKALREGRTQRDVADEFGLSASMINIEWRIALEEFIERQDEDVKIIRAGKLLELGEVKRKANEGWERSLRAARRKMTEEQTDGKGGRHSKEVEETKGRVGDPRFLSIIGKCIEHECQLLGLDDQKMQQIQVNVFDSLASGEGIDPIEARMAALLAQRQQLAALTAPEGDGTIVVYPEPDPTKVPFPTLSS